jgi:pseudouridine synthase
MAAERLQKLLARAGIGSRRACEELIAGGRVWVDGAVVKELGSKADIAAQDVRIDGRRLRPEPPEYWILNKPKGVVCTNYDPSGRRRPMDFMTQTKARLFPVGRLDADSKGLLLMTNDGDLANHLTHPRYEVPKTYVATVDGEVPADQVRSLRGGVHLAEGRTGGADVRIVNRGRRKSIVEMTIHEGRNRQVRRMLARLGHPVRELVRTRIGRITLKGLAPGESRRLTPEEVEYLRTLPQEVATRPGRPGRVRRRARRAGLPEPAAPAGSAEKKPRPKRDRRDDGRREGQGRDRDRGGAGRSSHSTRRPARSGPGSPPGLPGASRGDERGRKDDRPVRGPQQKRKFTRGGPGSPPGLPGASRGDERGRKDDRPARGPQQKRGFTRSGPGSPPGLPGASRGRRREQGDEREPGDPPHPFEANRRRDEGAAATPEAPQRGGRGRQPRGAKHDGAPRGKSPAGPRGKSPAGPRGKHDKGRQGKHEKGSRQSHDTGGTGKARRDHGRDEGRGAGRGRGRSGPGPARGRGPRRDSRK